MTGNSAEFVAKVTAETRIYHTTVPGRADRLIKTSCSLATLADVASKITRLSLASAADFPTDLVADLMTALHLSHTTWQTCLAMAIDAGQLMAIPTEVSTLMNSIRTAVFEHAMPTIRLKLDELAGETNLGSREVHVARHC